MDRKLYELYNTQTEQVEATEIIDEKTAFARNDSLRQNGEPQRWVAAHKYDYNAY